MPSKGFSSLPQLEKNATEFGRVLIVYNFPQVIDPYKVSGPYKVLRDIQISRLLALGQFKSQPT